MGDGAPLVLIIVTGHGRSASKTPGNILNNKHSHQALRLVCSLLGLILVAGCVTGPTIRSNADESVDFTAFRTFAFIEPLGTDREGYQSLISQQLVTSAERELTARGLQRTATNPDLLINFSANLDQRLWVTQSPDIPQGGFHRHRHRHRQGFYNTWPTYQRTEIRQYTKGTLGVDVVDTARRQLVWEGFAMGRVTQRTTDNIGAVLDAAVVDIFARFPLQPKQPSPASTGN